MKTPFYRLAGFFEKNNISYPMCSMLISSGNTMQKHFLEKWFSPSSKEAKKYNHNYLAWGKCELSEKETINFRITALLFADLLWQEEMKGGGK